MLKKELGRRDVPAVAYQRHDPDVVSLVPKDWPRSETSHAPIELPQAAMLDAPQRHESEVVSLVVPRTNEGTAGNGGPRGPDGTNGPSDQPIELPRAPLGAAAVAELPIHISQDDQVAHERPSARRRIRATLRASLLPGWSAPAPR